MVTKSAGRPKAGVKTNKARVKSAATPKTKTTPATKPNKAKAKFKLTATTSAGDQFGAF